MTDPRPLTPAEVRELLAYEVGMEFTQPFAAALSRFRIPTAVFHALRDEPVLRATLERYAELAGAFDAE